MGMVFDRSRGTTPPRPDWLAELDAAGDADALAPTFAWATSSGRRVRTPSARPKSGATTQCSRGSIGGPCNVRQCRIVYIPGG
jgi:hypothetical protein